VTAFAISFPRSRFSSNRLSTKQNDMCPVLSLKQVQTVEMALYHPLHRRCSDLGGVLSGTC
jgi:hypothetical protein